MQKKLQKATEDIIKKNYKNLSSGEILTVDTAIKIKQNILNELSKKFDKEVCRKYLDQLFEFKININEISKISKINYKQKIKVPKKYQKLSDHFDFLWNVPQPEQRTPEWYKFRHDRITASDIATALNHNPYEPWEEFLVKKSVDNYPFYDHDIVFHGKKHEEVATKIYQEIFNIKVDEFGCLPHPTIPFLGASPDGICSRETLDGQFSERLGVMLEIKCPTGRVPYLKGGRTMYHSGEIKGHLCPHYYWYQCQVQLECCDLEQCDFWQCDIEEISLEEYRKGEFETNYTQGIDGSPLEVPSTCRQGVIIQFLPKNYVPRYVNEEFNKRKYTDKIEFQGKVIYPDRLNYNYVEYNEWILDTLEKVKDDPEYEDYYFDKVIYWRLTACHNVAVMRDREWFAKHLPILEDTWKQVEYHRKHPELMDDIRKISEKKRAFWRYKTNYHISSKEITENKTLFLEDNYKQWESEDDTTEEDCEFVD